MKTVHEIKNFITQFPAQTSCIESYKNIQFHFTQNELRLLSIYVLKNGINGTSDLKRLKYRFPYMHL